MRLHIEQRERKGIAIPDLKGPLTLGQGCLGLRDKLAALSASGKVNIILNLQTVAETFSEDELDAVDSFFPEPTLKHFDVLEFVDHKNQRGANLEISGPFYLLR